MLQNHLGAPLVIEEFSIVLECTWEGRVCVVVWEISM
jgi:hypothetical protein